MTYIDTQIVVWLHDGSHKKIPKRALKEIDEAESLLISPMVELELNFLRTRKGMRIHESKAIEDLMSRTGLEICQIPFALVITESLSISWTDDIFDRIIVAQASATNSKLVTADAKIRAHYKHTVWE